MDKLNELRKKHHAFQETIKDMRRHLQKAKEYYWENLEGFRKELYLRHQFEADKWYGQFVNMVTILKIKESYVKELRETIKTADLNGNNDNREIKLKRRKLLIIKNEILQQKENISEFYYNGMNEIFGQDAEIMNPDVIKSFMNERDLIQYQSINN